MEADCGDYLDPLSYDIEGHMAFVVSNWDNRDGREDFERDDAPNPTNDCSVGSWEFSEFNVWQYGYNEEQEDDTPTPDPDPQPEPATVQSFIGYAQENGQEEGWYEFFVKGLDGSFLQTDNDKTIEIGFNNRAFINDYEWFDSALWSHKHDSYLGGTLQYDVDLSDVPCQCATGVFLAHVDDDECSWDAHPVASPPQCDTIAIMEANDSGILTNLRECSSGTCTDPRQC